MSIIEATATAVSGMAFGFFGVVLGQIPAVAENLPENAPNWLNACGGVVSLGFAVWFAYWTVTKTLPEKDRAHAATINSIVQEFRQESKEQRQLHTAAVDKIDVSMDRLSSVIERALLK